MAWATLRGYINQICEYCSKEDVVLQITRFFNTEYLEGTPDAITFEAATKTLKIDRDIARI